MVPDLILASLPRQLVLFKDDSTRVGISSLSRYDVVQGNRPIPLFVIDGNPFPDRGNLGNKVILARSQAIDTDPILLRVRRWRVPRDADGLTDVVSLYRSVRGRGEGKGVLRSVKGVCAAGRSTIQTISDLIHCMSVGPT
jgi:hypothetical protein